MRSKNNLPKRNSDQNERLHNSPLKSIPSTKLTNLMIKRKSPSSAKFMQRLMARSPSKPQRSKASPVAGSPLRKQLFDQNTNKASSSKSSPSRHKKITKIDQKVNSSPPKLNWVITPTNGIKTFGGSKSSPFDDLTSSPFNDDRPRSLPNYNSPALGARRSPRKLGLILPRKMASPLAPRKLVAISPKVNLWKSSNHKRRGTFGRSSSFSAQSDVKRKTSSKASSIAPLASTLDSEFGESPQHNFVPIIPNSTFDELFSTTDQNDRLFDDFLENRGIIGSSSSYAKNDILSDLFNGSAPSLTLSAKNTSNLDLNTDDLFGSLMPTRSAPELNRPCNGDNLLSMFADPTNIPRTEVEDLYKEIMEDGTYNLGGTSDKMKSIDWVINSKAGFSTDQLTNLKSQLQSTLQFTIQMTVLEKAIYPPKKNFSGKYFENSLLQLTQSCGKSKQRYGEASIANIPGLQKVESLLKMMPTAQNHIFAQKFQKAKETDSKKKASVPLPSNVEKILNIFKDEFNPDLLPKLVPTTRKDKKTSFIAVEDELLLQGVIFYGEKDFASIQAHYLPGKSIAQISSRFKNLTERNQASSKIKDFYLMPFKPMTYNEKFWLRYGILTYGSNFKTALPIIFPHIPFPIIETAWNDLYRIGLVPIQWNSIEADLHTSFKNTLSSNMSEKLPPRIAEMPSSTGEILVAKSKIPAEPNSFGAIPKLFISQSSPNIPLLQTRGVSRGGNKKRFRIDKDLIDSSKKKFRPKMNDPRRMDPITNEALFRSRSINDVQ